MKRAIIADDEPAVKEIIKHIIQTKNLQIDIIGEAVSGKQAVSLIESLKPDIAFIDIEMPIYNGFEVIQKVRELGISNTEFIIITAYGYFEYAQTAFRKGAKDILLKPIESGKFCECVDRVCGFSITPNSLINQVLDFISKNYNKEYKLNDIAGIFFISPFNLSRLFKKHTSKNYIEYLHEVRIKKALEMLDANTESIKEIAEKAGYTNLNNFYKHFKDYSGTTPRAYLENKFGIDKK